MCMKFEQHDKEFTEKRKRNEFHPLKEKQRVS